MSICRADAGDPPGFTGFAGRIVYDTSKPDGTPRKLMDVSRLTEMGWTARVPFEDALQATYQWYLENEGTWRSRAFPAGDSRTCPNRKYTR